MRKAAHGYTKIKKQGELEMIENKLKRCPFCGSVVRTRKAEVKSPDGVIYGELFVFCPECKSLTCFSDGETIEKLTTLWNKRVTEVQL